MKILKEILKVLVLEIPLLIMSYVLFIFSFLCATDPELFSKFQENICAVVKPATLIVVLASPLFSILIYLALRVSGKAGWKHISITALALLFVSFLLFMFKGIVF